MQKLIESFQIIRNERLVAGRESVVGQCFNKKKLLAELRALHRSYSEPVLDLRFPAIERCPTEI